MPFELCTLGRIDLRGPDRRSLVALLAQPKRVALLTYLALEGNSAPCRRDTLLGLFWPDSDSARARGALRQAVHFLRQTIDEGAVRRIGDTALALGRDLIRCDAIEFGDACAEKRLDDALDLYRGEFLSGLFIPDASPELDDWLVARRAALKREAVDAASALVALCRRDGQLATAERLARRAVSFAPEDETLHRTLLEVLGEAGNRSGAVRAYGELAEELKRELGVSPSAATQALIVRIRDSEIDRPMPSGADIHCRNSIAVVTFVNMTGDIDQDFLCHGLTEELMVVLGRAEGIRIVPIPAGYGLKGREPDVCALRERLNVDFVLDGSVWRAGSMGRVSAHVIDARDSHQVWAESHEREWAQIATLRGHIVRAFAAGIELAVTGRRAQQPNRPTANVEAYNAYLKGRFYWNQRPRVTDATLKHLGIAVELDPAFALAHAAIADAYNILGAWEGSVMPPLEAMPKAQAAALRALELDPDLAEAHTALGYANIHYLWQWDAGERQLRRALALKPNYGHAHHWLSHLMMARGRAVESLEESVRALESDPLDLVINIHLAWHYWMARDYERALEQCARTAELDRNEHWAPMFAGFVHVERGDAGAAIDAHRTALERSNGSPVLVAALGYSYAAGGERRLAQSVLRRLRDLGAHRGMYGYEMAIIHGALGALDAAFDQLGRALRERSTWMAYLGVDPRLDRLRRDPRFASLLDVTGLGASGEVCRSEKRRNHVVRKRRRELT